LSAGPACCSTGFYQQRRRQSTWVHGHQRTCKSTPKCCTENGSGAYGLRVVSSPQIVTWCDTQGLVSSRIYHYLHPAACLDGAVGGRTGAQGKRPDQSPDRMEAHTQFFTSAQRRAAPTQHGAHSQSARAAPSYLQPNVYRPRPRRRRKSGQAPYPARQGQRSW